MEEKRYKSIYRLKERGEKEDFPYFSAFLLNKEQNGNKKTCTILKINTSGPLGTINQCTRSNFYRVPNM